MIHLASLNNLPNLIHSVFLNDLFAVIHSNSLIVSLGLIHLQVLIWFYKGDSFLYNKVFIGCDSFYAAKSFPCINSFILFKRLNYYGFHSDNLNDLPYVIHFERLKNSYMIIRLFLLKNSYHAWSLCGNKSI